MNAGNDVLAVLLDCFEVAVNDGFYEEAEEIERAGKAIARLIDAAAALRTVLSVHGDFDDGCYYYQGRSASELQAPIAMIDAALLEVKSIKTAAAIERAKEPV